jgi:hypothetical protein
MDDNSYSPKRIMGKTPREETPTPHHDIFEF